MAVAGPPVHPHHRQLYRTPTRPYRLKGEFNGVLLDHRFSDEEEALVRYRKAHR